MSSKLIDLLILLVYSYFKVNFREILMKIILSGGYIII